MLGKMNDLMGGYNVIVTTTNVQRRRHKRSASIKSGLSGMDTSPKTGKSVGKRS